MDHWTENYCEEENNLLAYERFMPDRFKTYIAFLFTVFEKFDAFWEFRFWYTNEAIYMLFY